MLYNYEYIGIVGHPPHQASSLVTLIESPHWRPLLTVIHWSSRPRHNSGFADGFTPVSGHQRVHIRFHNGAHHKTISVILIKRLDIVYFYYPACNSLVRQQSSWTPQIQSVRHSCFCGCGILRSDNSCPLSYFSNPCYYFVILNYIASWLISLQ